MQVPARPEQLVDVRQLAVLEAPGGANDAVRIDQEGAAPGDVSEAAELLADPERADSVAVEVREQPEVQVERLGPRDVRPRRVA